MIPFTGSPLDRASDQRVDPAWLAARRSDSGSRVLPVWRLQPFLTGPETRTDPKLGLVAPAVADRLCENTTGVFLGLDNETAVFALDISALEDPLAGPLNGLGHFRDARSAAQLVGGTDAAIIGQARSLIDWHARHQFCGQCGTRTELKDAGYRRLCSSCQAEHFPRTDPAVIMLVVHGDHCMLGRNRRFPDGYYSALAGFLEPGENVEEAVRRETFEEAGVRIGAVRYVASQYWPFPSSLMIGCIAEAAARETKPDGVEILETRWFDKQTIRSMFDGTIVLEGVHLPSPIAIAHHLLRAWVKE
jgi:NAD+ diphosphatase